MHRITVYYRYAFYLNTLISLKTFQKDLNRVALSSFSQTGKMHGDFRQHKEWSGSCMGVVGQEGLGGGVVRWWLATERWDILLIKHAPIDL